MRGPATRRSPTCASRKAARRRCRCRTRASTPSCRSRRSSTCRARTSRGCWPRSRACSRRTACWSCRRPIRSNTRRRANYRNPFHLHEPDRAELGALLASAFPVQRWFRQRRYFGSAVWSEAAGEIRRGVDRRRGAGRRGAAARGDVFRRGRGALAGGAAGGGRGAVAVHRPRRRRTRAHRRAGGRGAAAGSPVARARRGARRGRRRMCSTSKRSPPSAMRRSPCERDAARLAASASSSATRSCRRTRARADRRARRAGAARWARRGRRSPRRAPNANGSSARSPRRSASSRTARARAGGFRCRGCACGSGGSACAANDDARDGASTPPMSWCRCTTRRPTSAPAWPACSRTCGPTCALVLIDDASPDPAIAAYFAELERLRASAVAAAAQRASTWASPARPIAACSCRARTSCCSTPTRSSPAAGSTRCCIARRPTRRSARSRRSRTTRRSARSRASARTIRGRAGAIPKPCARRSRRRRCRPIPTCRRASASASSCAARCSTRSASSTRRSARGTARRTTCACAPRARAGATCSPTTRSSCTPAAGRSPGRRPSSAPRNMALLLERHPHYLDMVRDYIAADPLRPLREAAAARLAVDAAPGRGVLHVIHHHGGGTETHVRALIAGSRGRWRHYLAIAVDDRWQVEEHRADGSVVTFEFVRGAHERWRDFVGGICATFGIALIHLHNISACRDGIIDRARRFPGAVRLHRARPQFRVPDDHVPRRRRHVLRRRDRRRRVRALPRGAADVRRRRHRGVARAAPRAAAARGVPDRAVALGRGHARAVFPGLRGRGRRARHAGRRRCRATGARTRGARLPDDGVPTVAVLGAIGPDKGARRLERLVALARARGAWVRFVLIGYMDVEHGPWQSDDAMFTVHGRYDPADLPDLLAHYRVALVLYPSAGPETFSYTLSEAWASGRPGARAADRRAGGARARQRRGLGDDRRRMARREADAGARACGARHGARRDAPRGVGRGAARCRTRSLARDDRRNVRLL